MNPDQEIALLHVPEPRRAALAALFAVDSAMGDVVARSTEPMLARIKLAWWSEQLEALDHGPPPAEPRLQAVAANLLPLGITGNELGGLEAGWSSLLDPEPDVRLVGERGARLFASGGRLLECSDRQLGEAGRLYALASAAASVPGLAEPARASLRELRGHRFERRARPLTMLARAASCDLGKAASPRSRALAMLAHRWSGRIG